MTSIVEKTLRATRVTLFRACIELRRRQSYFAGGKSSREKQLCSWRLAAICEAQLRLMGYFGVTAKLLNVDLHLLAIYFPRVGTPAYFVQ